MKGKQNPLNRVFLTCLEEGTWMPRTSKRKRAAIIIECNYCGSARRGKARALHAIFGCFQVLFISLGSLIKSCPSLQEEEEWKVFDRMVVLVILFHSFHAVRNFPKIPVLKAPAFLKSS